MRHSKVLMPHTVRTVDPRETRLADVEAALRASETALRAETETLETIVSLGQRLTGALEREQLLQLFTDTATKVSGATAGAFVGYSADEHGEHVTLDALCGAPREAWGDFPAPEMLTLIEPALRGLDVVRCSDLPGGAVGHLQVRSLLAAGVFSHATDVLGVLVLLHPEAGAFEAREVRLVAWVAAQAAVAIDNARLHERQQRARAEAEAANRSKDEFLATLSHELRTPLSAILGWARMLREGGLTAVDEGRALEVIERNAKVQIQLIEDLLDVSRIVSGKAELDIRPVHPVTLIEAVLDSMRPGAAAKSISLESSLDLRGGPIAADPARMQQVLWNLVANAIKFTARGGRIDVRLARAEPNVEIAVSDTGEGIRPEMLPHVFERFRQGDSSTTRRHGGLGLGLTLVKHLVEAHGGTVTADSAGPGQGATFTVRLPLLGQTDPAVVRRARLPARASSEARLDGCRVLAVDDDADARELFAHVLGRVGATVHTAASVAEAFEVLAGTPLDVVLADLQMPDEDGFALIERLRASGRHLPAVAVTAYGSTDDRVRVLAAGFDAHMAKPVDTDELVTVIRRLVG